MRCYPFPDDPVLYHSSPLSKHANWLWAGRGGDASDSCDRDFARQFRVIALAGRAAPACAANPQRRVQYNGRADKR
jgi:hypothetical protein